jgi:broad specificity phosphatase PhoE/CTP:molybdopterin cytidylyltransferase MocA/HD superfamily phosphodiesterase
MTQSGAIASLILAAGYSSRMGTFKPLLPLGGSTLIEEAVKRFRDAGIQDIRVVVGYRAEEIAPVLDRLGVRSIFNPEFDKGMLSSLLAGLRSFDSGTEALFLLPSDVPLVKPATIRALIHAYRRDGARIIYPRFQGLRGHPPLVPTTCVADLPADYGGGLRAFLSRYDKQAIDVDVVDESVLMDCDTPEDYRKLQAYRSMEGIPTEQECAELWARYDVSGNVIAHCRLVAELARTLALHLNRAGFNLNADLVVASGYLHDLARAQPDHARAGARVIEELGYPLVARVVASHMDIRPKRRGLDESDLIFLADKCVEEDRLVALEERFESSMSRFAGKPGILQAVERRFRAARIIRERLEKLTGVSLDGIIRKYEKSMRMASTSWRKNIWLVRHGAIEHRGSARRYTGQMDLPLSAEGVRQAESLRDRMRGIPLSAVFCSDLSRSIETASIICGPHGLDPFVNRNWREIGLGDWEGVTLAEVQERFPGQYEERGKNIVLFRPPGGESFLDCAFRVIPALFEALRSTRGDMLIVGHAGVNRILICQAMGKAMDAIFDIAQDYGCLNLIRYSNFGFELEILNETVQPQKEQKWEMSSIL